jgi:hypothetical protein
MARDTDIEQKTLKIIEKADHAATAISKHPSMAGGIAASTLNAFMVSADLARLGHWSMAREQQLRLTILRTIDALVRLGTFYQSKLGLALLAASPLAITVSFDKAYNMIQRGLESLGTEQGFTNVLEQVSGDVASEMGNLLVGLVRTQMASLPIQAYGGSYAAPLTASGQLADAVGILESGPLRRYSRGKGARPLTHVVTVGVKPGSGRAAYYGNVLARSIPSRAPMLQYGPKVGFGQDAWGRFFAWGSLRGHSQAETRRIAAKIWREGTYGRAWMAVIATQTFNLPMTSLASSFAYRIMKYAAKGGAT